MGSIYEAITVYRLLKNVSSANLWRFDEYEEQVDQDTKDCSCCDRRPTEGEDTLEQRNRQVAAVSNVAADADDQDQGHDGQFSGIKEVNFLSHHQGNTLNANDTIQVDGQATSDGGRDAVDDVAEWSDEAKDAQR